MACWTLACFHDIIMFSVCAGQAGGWGRGDMDSKLVLGV